MFEIQSPEKGQVKQMCILYLMLVSCDLIGQLNGRHLLNVTQFLQGV